MKSRYRKNAVLGALLLLTAFSGCGSTGEKEKTAYQFSITEAEKAQVPYTLSGEADGWKVACRVREAGEEEKTEILEGIRQAGEGLQNLYEQGKTELTEEEFQHSMELYRQQEQEVSEKSVYLSEIAGCYLGEETLPEAMLTYCLRNKQGETLVRGSVNASVQTAIDWETPWYRSEQTDGAYFTSFFIPPEENACLEITLEEETAVIPLTLRKGLF